MSIINYTRLIGLIVLALNKTNIFPQLFSVLSNGTLLVTSRVVVLEIGLKTAISKSWSHIFTVTSSLSRDPVYLNLSRS